MYFSKLHRNSQTICATASLIVGLSAGVALAASVGSASSAGPPAAATNKPQPAPDVQSPPAEDSPVPARGVKEIQVDLRENSAEISAVLVDKPDLRNSAKRAKLAVLLIPLEYRLISLLDELVKLQPSSRGQIDSMRQRAVAMLYLFNDAAIVKSVNATRSIGNRHEVSMARAIQILSQWIMNTEDAAARGVVADQLIELDEANPSEAGLTALTYSLSRETAYKATAEKLSNAAIAMTNPIAKAVAAQVSASRRPASLQTSDKR